MSQLRQRMLEEMQLRRYATKTQEAYVHRVSELAKYYHKSPDQIEREEVRKWFVYLTNERKLSHSSVTTALSALKFFYESVLHRVWGEFHLVRPRAEKKLPRPMGTRLSVAEVQRLLSCVEVPRYRVCLSVLYSCGAQRAPRLQEGTHLRVSQIDSNRMMLHIQGGKGNKDRAQWAPVPLPQPTLELLRSYWCPKGPRTHLLEAGVNLRLIQTYLGQESLATTAIYTHLRRHAETVASETINRLMTPLMNVAERSDAAVSSEPW